MIGDHSRRPLFVTIGVLILTILIDIYYYKSIIDHALLEWIRTSDYWLTSAKASLIYFIIGGIALILLDILYYNETVCVENIMEWFKITIIFSIINFITFPIIAFWIKFIIMSIIVGRILEGLSAKEIIW